MSTATSETTLATPAVPNLSAPSAPMMAVPGVSADAVAQVSIDRRYRLSVAQYHRMIEVDILSPDDKIELLEGILVRKMGKNAAHIATTRLIQRALDQRLPPGWMTSKEDPITLERSEPEPDVAVLRGSLEDYFQRKPGPRDVPLVVEVSDATYADDRLKIRLYAEAGIPRTWIVNLTQRRIEEYSDPTGPDVAPDYRTRQDHGLEDEVTLWIESRDLARLPVRELLPPAVSGA